MLSSSYSEARLVLAGRLLVIVGLALAVPAMLGLPLLDAIYALVRTGDPMAGSLDEAAQFGAAIAGALTLGWGWMIAALAAGRSLPVALRQAVLAWFVVDSAASALLGFGGNVVSNLGFVLVIWWATSEATRTSAEPAPGV